MIGDVYLKEQNGMVHHDTNEKVQYFNGTVNGTLLHY